MGAGSRFVITELQPTAAAYTGGDPARFEWDVAHRNMPHRPWEITKVLRTTRTNYPGTSVPSEQVFGAHFDPFTVEGEWLDKWNAVGYAEAERDLFEQMFDRGNRCRFEYRSFSFIGLITKFTATVFDPFRIHYRFEVSPHKREGADEPVKRPAPLDPRAGARALRENLRVMLGASDTRARREQENASFGANSIAPPSLRASSIHEVMLLGVRDVTEAVDTVLTTIESVTVDPAADAVSGLLAIASGFAIIRGRCQTTLDKVAGVRSDTQAAGSGLDHANFELWRLGILAQLRAMQAIAYDAELDAVTQAKPDVMRIHEAKRGETLMGLALRYYGAADAWTVIADRNGIDDFTLQGGELLVIPSGAR